MRSTDHGHSTDAHNLRILQDDPRLQRILRAYQRQDEAGRALMAQRVEQIPIPEVDHDPDA